MDFHELFLREIPLLLTVILMLTISTHNLNREFGSYPAVKEIDLELAHGEALRFFTLREQQDYYYA
jgi:hypothetical protein